MPATLLTGVEKALTKNELVMAEKVNLLIKFGLHLNLQVKKRKPLTGILRE